MRLKELRERKKLTQEEVAKANNIIQASYSNYEREKTEPDIDILIKLADFYNVSIDYLLENETGNEFYIGHLTQDKQNALKTLIGLNQINFIKAYSYISGLYATQS